MKKLFRMFQWNKQKGKSNTYNTNWIGNGRPLDKVPSKAKYDDFKLQFKNTITPFLNYKGFKGSGLTYRRVTENIIYVITFSRNGLGSRLSCDLGIHIKDYNDKLDYTGQPIDKDNIKIHQCDIWTRLKPSIWEGDFWWGLELNENQLIVLEIKQLLQNEGDSFFKLYQNYPDPFLNLKSTDLEKNDYSKFGSPTWFSSIKLAYVSAKLLTDEKSERANDIINWGLDKSSNIKSTEYQLKFSELKNIANKT